MLLHRLAGSMLVVAVPFFVIDRYGLGWESGLALAARLVPNVVFGIVVGHVVDRWEPRVVAWSTALVNAVVVASVPLTQSLAQLQLLMFAAGVVYTFGLPARMALRPVVIEEGEETRGNAVIVTAERLSSIVGPLLVGLLIATVGVEASFPAQGGITVLSGLLVWGLPNRPAREGASGGVRDELRQMFVTGPVVLVRALAGDRMLCAVVLTAFTYGAAVAVGEVFTAGLAKDHFADHPGSNGWLVAAMGTGGVLGALLSTALGRFHPGRLYFVGNVLEGLAWLALPWVDRLPLALLCMVAAGFLESVATVVYFAEVQKRLPPEMTGRFYATFIPLMDAFEMVGALTAPVLLASTGVGGTATVICLLIAVPVLLGAPVLLRRSAANPRTEART
ncbi:MFS transporter [Saccharopolyspora hordei]|uniref:MFS family permease n=1 Tax=Saccharopolyspora hordei TaxID=1838 RepID=A0A853AMS7_9PSEU|nr:MFS family permease [Saccharopolyspora hordei]